MVVGTGFVQVNDDHVLMVTDLALNLSLIHIYSCKLMKMKVLIRSLVLLAGLAAWTADTAWGQSSSRHRCV